jgi:hypothetical protein
MKYDDEVNSLLYSGRWPENGEYQDVGGEAPEINEIAAIEFRSIL